MKLTAITSLVLFIAVLACNGDKQNKSLDREKFVRIYTDYMQITLSDTARAEKKNAYLQQVLQHHGVKQQAFETYYQTLKKNPEKMESVLGDMIKTLRRLQNKK